MPLARHLAEKLLHTAVRYSPAGTAEWSSAMLHELEAIECDWAALHWAIGGVSAIVQASAGACWRSLKQSLFYKEQTVNNLVAKKAAGAAVGMALALGLSLCAFGLYALSVYLFPSLEAGRVPWVAWLAVIALPEAMFVAIVVGRWRKNRSMALGVTAFGIVLAVHFAIHVANHWNG
jgi:hypothetical protein